MKQLRYRWSARLCVVSMILSVASCVIIVNPNDGNKPDPIPVPVPTPLTCVESSEMPRAHLYFSMRIERSTVAMSEAYQMLMTEVAAGLAGAGIQVTQAYLIRADERPIEAPLLAAWGCNLDTPERLQPNTVIRHYAQADPPEPSPIGCVTDPLLDVASNLQSLHTNYPPGLGGTSGLGIYGDAPDVLIVIHLDSLSRTRALSDPECAPSMAFAQEDWISFANGQLPMDRIVHWFATTDEGVNRDTFIKECRSVEGFPIGLLDSIEPSTKQIYTPLAEEIASAGGISSRLSFCEIFVSTKRVELVKNEVILVASLLDIEADEDKVLAYITGEFPQELPDGVIPTGR